MKHLTLLSALFVLSAPQALATVSPAGALYDRAMTAVKENFHDKSFRGLPFDELVAAGRRELDDKSDRLGPVSGAVFAKLAPSAPLLATEDDQIYWTLKNAAGKKLDAAPVRHIGAWFERRGKRWFISEVFLGTPAAEAGLIRGDEVVSVEGQPLMPVRSFRLAPSTAKLKLEIKRVPWEKPREIAVGTISETFQASMERSMRRAYRIIDVQGKRVAYVPLPAATHAELRDTFMDLARRAETQADAMVLDLRGNYGGLDMTYDEAVIAGPNRPALFTKRLVVLVDEETSTGKEWLAWLVQRQKRGQIVGARTAGAWRAGRLVDLAPDAALLYLGAPDGAQMPKDVIDGQGVQPDLAVDQSLMYAAGEDAPLKAALNALAK